MTRKFERWFEVSYQKQVYGPIHNEKKKFLDLQEALDYANEIKERFPMFKGMQVWVDECTLEKKEIK